jgi:hypothetical protein
MRLRVKLHREASEFFALGNRRPESVGCPDPGCICKASVTLRPWSYEGSEFDCYHLIVVENGIRIVVAPGLITCYDKPVKTIDWLSLSLRWHVASIVAASPNPQPSDDVLYKRLGPIHTMIINQRWVQHTPSTAYTKYIIHWVQHTLSTAYTEYSIHRVQHPLSTAHTEYSIHWIQPMPSTAYTVYSIHYIQHILCTAYTVHSIHWVQHTLSIAYTEYSMYWIHLIPSTVYTKYSINQRQFTPSTALTDCSIYRVKYKSSIVFTKPRIH